VTRGDLTLCRKLMKRDEDVLALDDNRDTALTIASMAGRQLVVKELLESGAMVHEKNRDLMNPLQLACVDEAQGNGEVVRLLVEAGAQIDAMCWDVTPLQAASSSGHYWATTVLLELGADPNIRNGSMMMALDYARDQDTAELIYDWMKGTLLPDQDLKKRMEELRKSQRRNGINMEIPGIQKEKQPRIFQSVRTMPLEEAFKLLDLEEDWVDEFRETGEHYAYIRRAWRRQILTHHPDKQPADMDDEKKAEITAKFQKAMAAFEVIDDFYATRGFAAKAAEEAANREAEDTPSGEAPATATSED